MDFTIFFTPVIGALIGYSTNVLAIRMLFRPFRPVYILGLRLPFTPGLIPKEQPKLAKKVANAIGKHILTPEIFMQELMAYPIFKDLDEKSLKEIFNEIGLEEPLCYIKNFLTLISQKTSGEILPESLAESVKGLVRKYLPKTADFIKDFEHPRLDEKGAEFIRKLIQEHVGRFAGMFLDPDKIYKSMKEGLATYLSEEENLEIISAKIDEGIDNFLGKNFLESADTVDSVAENINSLAESLWARLRKQTLVKRILKGPVSRLIKHVNIEDMVERRVAAFEPEEAEALILSVVRRELHLVMILGGILGFIIGWLPVIL